MNVYKAPKDYNSGELIFGVMLPHLKIARKGEATPNSTFTGFFDINELSRKSTCIYNFQLEGQIIT